MSTKREERRQRSEAQKQDRERHEKQKAWRSRVVLIAGALVLVTIAVIVRRERLRENAESGRIWSAAHGHWHDRYGMEIR